VLGFNAKKSAAESLLGFALYRQDHTENKEYWLPGFKTFEETVPDPVPGKWYSTLEHPVQSFQWGDYTAKINHDYTYRVVPLTGTPTNLIQGTPVEIRIQTESEDSGKHSVYFNRGVAGSQAYSAKFGNKSPEEIEDRRAFIWLSRGLEEAILQFIDRANSDEYGLRASVYEFSYYPVLEAFRRASENGADVKIVYDSRQEYPRDATDESIEWANIRPLMIRRTQPKSYISHNKFIVLLKDSVPLEVWTGSTNFTNGGIFGQANVGHIVRDQQVAKKYYDYWVELAKDPGPTNAEIKQWTGIETPDPEGECCPNTITPLFSPKKTLKTLEWYAERMDAAKETVCLTAAFGVHSLLAAVLGKDKEYLRYVLLNSKANNFEVFSQDPDVRIAVGSHFADALHQWTREVLTGYNHHVKYVHTKFMLIDPLSNNPTVITGSANFSEASTKNNDENMLVVQDDIRIADIYMGEFFRLFHHFYFRYVMNNQKAKAGSEDKESSYLKPDSSWTEKYYVPDSIKEKQRILFSRNLT
jgi:phosphatidylserine/phosphatidylglycerophosphate/cardiolipin synthase-like enzyme